MLNLWVKKGMRGKEEIRTYRNLTEWWVAVEDGKPTGRYHNGHKWERKAVLILEEMLGYRLDRYEKAKGIIFLDGDTLNCSPSNLHLLPVGKRMLCCDCGRLLSRTKVELLMTGERAYRCNFCDKKLLFASEGWKEIIQKRAKTLRKRYPAVNIQEAKTRYESGESWTVIGRSFGMLGITVKKQVLAQVKIKLRGRFHRLVNIEEVVDRYSKGEGCNTIGKSFGVTGGMIRSRLKLAGVTTRHTRTPKISNDDVKRIRDRAEPVKNLKGREVIWRSIAEEYGVSLATVQKIIYLRDRV